MSLHSELIRELLRDPRQATRLVFPFDHGTTEGRALIALVDYCRGHGDATMDAILGHFAKTEHAKIFTPHCAPGTNRLQATTPYGDVDYFLLSREWAAVRMEALVRDAGRCKCCGRTAADGVVINVDHIRPRRRYPELALSMHNLQVLCADCNTGKGNKFETDWRSPKKTKASPGAAPCPADT